MPHLPTEDLIDKLVADGTPVRRLLTPMTRATIWLVIFLTLSSTAIWIIGDITGTLRRLHVTRVALEMTGTSLTGVGAVIAAFFLSLPDRSRFWILLPVPPLLLWLATAGYGCYMHWVEFGPGGWALGESGDCFLFIVGVSIPSGWALYWALKRAVPLDTLSVTVLGGLGVAALSATVLQFFHPFEVTLVDLSAHAAAILAVVTLMTTMGRSRLASAIERRG